MTPPSTSMIVPVNQLALSESRNSIAALPDEVVRKTKTFFEKILSGWK
jgi:hypothetical protein